MRTCCCQLKITTVKDFKFLQRWISEAVVVSLTCSSLYLLYVPRAIAQADGRAAPERVSSVSRIEDPYTLGAGDRIRVDVFQLPQYSGELDVLVGGVVNLPVIGAVSVDSMTLEQATRAIASRYSQILRQPTVSLSLLSRRSLQIGVSGEVNHPGSYTISSSDTEFPTLTQVLEEAGGIRLSADLSQIEIRRQGLNGASAITVNLLTLLRVGGLSEDITLRDGDTVVVPAADRPDLQNLAELPTLSFAGDDNQEINIAVVGEVFRPGSHTVTGSAQTGEAGETGQTQGAGRLPTVTRAIQVAGGIKPLADVRNIQILRNTREGIDQTIQVNLWQLLQTGDLRQDLALQEGDTIIVPTAEEDNMEESAQLASASFSPDSIRVNIVGEIDKPGVVEIPPNSSLTQGLLSAGGFNNRASRGTVDLIRLNPNGTVLARSIPVDFEQGINQELNPALQNGDVIIVRRSAIASVSDALETVASPIGRFFSLITAPFSIIRLFD